MNRFGWSPNPEGVEAVKASLPHPAQLFAAAPHWRDDGMTGDLKPYLAIYEIEVPGWKKKGEDFPYDPQPGNNCTSEGLSHGADDMQAMDIADPLPDATSIDSFRRACTEATYAFGLYKAGMRGDNGCYGGAMGKGGTEIGFVSYEMVGGEQTETGSRLRQFARDPGAVVREFGDKAAPYRFAKMVQVTTWEEYCAAIANRGVVTVASDVGFESPRDAKGICRARGRWPHQMHAWGVIRSDGIESAVMFQSWGRGNVCGQQQPELLDTDKSPFRLPSNAFRVVRSDFERQLAAGDTWAFFGLPGFVKTPLAPRFTLTDAILL